TPPDVLVPHVYECLAKCTVTLVRTKNEPTMPSSNNIAIVPAKCLAPLKVPDFSSDRSPSISADDVKQALDDVVVGFGPVCDGVDDWGERLIDGTCDDEGLSNISVKFSDSDIRYLSQYRDVLYRVREVRLENRPVLNPLALIALDRSV